MKIYNSIAFLQILWSNRKAVHKTFKFFGKLSIGLLNFERQLCEKYNFSKFSGKLSTDLSKLVPNLRIKRDLGKLSIG